MDRAARANFYRVTYHGTRLDHGIISNLGTLAYKRARTNPHSVAERHVLLNVSASIYRHSSPQ
jgi:hypothetical protein